MPLEDCRAVPFALLLEHIDKVTHLVEVKRVLLKSLFGEVLDSLALLTAVALLAVQRAQAESIRLINEANPSNQYLTLKKYEAAAQMADGQATKIVVPSDIANLAGTVSAIAEVAKSGQSTKTTQE